MIVMRLMHTMFVVFIIPPNRLLPRGRMLHCGLRRQLQTPLIELSLEAI